MVVQTALGEEFEEVGVRAKVKGRLVFGVLGIELCSIGSQEDSNGGAALLVRVAQHEGLHRGEGPLDACREGRGEGGSNAGGTCLAHVVGCLEMFEL